MPAELNPSSDFFPAVRRILADAQRTVYTANIHQSHTLATQHDTMPPKLLSGDLSV